MKPEQNESFEQAVEQYANTVIAIEKEQYQPGIEPFDVYANKIRLKVSEAMHAFYDSYTHGYAVLIDELRAEFPVTELNPDPLAPYLPKKNSHELLSDPMKFMNFLDDGHSIYEALGYTSEALEGFYQAAYKLIEQKRFEDARDGFYFLVTIAPLFGAAWLGLGYSYAECKMQDAAIEACKRAVELMPDSPDSYLTFARVFINMQDFEQAKKVCEGGIEHATLNKDSPWAKELIEYMEEAKRQIDQLFQKSQSESYPS